MLSNGRVKFKNSYSSLKLFSITAYLDLWGVITRDVA